LSQWSEFRDFLIPKKQEERSINPLAFEDWMSFFSWNGTNYPFIQQAGVNPTQTEEIGGDYGGLIEGAYKRNGAVFALMEFRRRIFSQAQFRFQRVEDDGRPGQYFTSKELRPLETPWANATTSDLLSLAIQTVDLAGNFYCRKVPSGIQPLRPDWMTIVLGSKLDADHPTLMPDTEVIGYMFHPGGINAGHDPIPYSVEEICHFKPIPDPPLPNFRGMSWLMPIVREIMGDTAVMAHKLRFLDSGAVPRTVITLDVGTDTENFEKWVQMFEQNFSGALNAYKTMYLSGGAQADVIGANMKEVDFKELASHGEARLAAAAGVPAVLAGFIPGLDASTYSNTHQMRRLFADATARDLWQNFADSMATIIQPPSGGFAKLAYDVRDVPFLREDEKDIAETMTGKAAAMNSLITAGYEPKSVTLAVETGDLSQLKHTGKTSVQLLAPGESGQTNGSGPPEAVPAPTKGASSE
jgi:phage portal protein BeeE